MLGIILVDKPGTLHEQKIKGNDTDKLYKKCGFKKPDDFECRNSWQINEGDICCIELWSRNRGKSGTENNYKLPASDDAKYFGNMIFVGVDATRLLVNLTLDIFNNASEQMFGPPKNMCAEPEDMCAEPEPCIEVLKEEETLICINMSEVIIAAALHSNKCIQPTDQEFTTGGSELEEEDYYYSDEDVFV